MKKCLILFAITIAMATTANAQQCGSTCNYTLPTTISASTTI